MNFFEHQEQARRQSRRMLWLFALSMVVIVAVIDAAVLLAIGLDVRRVGWQAMLFVSLSVVLVIQLGSLYRVATLRTGGKAVALGMGAVPVPPSSGDFAYRRLSNVVEEIAIASGVPVPEIFVLEEEAGINAFAAGYAPTDAAITVTRGALDKLTRSELQGVIGHEFSHVLNGDMRLNIRLMGIVFGLLVISTVGRRIASGGRGGGSAVLLGFALFVAGYLGVVLARLIKASISRQREFLADASAVQFTRETEGIAGALKKIGALAEGSRLGSRDTEEISHMLFGDGVGYSALFATHPPLVTRIRRLDPAFRAELWKEIAAAWSRPVRVGGARLEQGDVSIAGFAPAGTTLSEPQERGVALPDAHGEVVLTPQAVARQVGNPGNDDRAIARTLRASIPEPLRAAAHQPESAVPLVFALLLNSEAAVRERQLAQVASAYDAGTREVVRAFGAMLGDLHPMQRLPLAALTFPILRRRPRAQLHGFVAVLRQLIDADGRVTLQEYCLARLVDLQVVAALDPAARAVIGRVKLGDAQAELRDLLAVLAAHGHDDEPAARRAYAAGLHEVLPNGAIAYAPPQQWTQALDRALPRLDRLAPAGKELVVRALTRAIATDGKVSLAEAELLRTVCAALHCPLPPMLQSSG